MNNQLRPPAPFLFLYIFVQCIFFSCGPSGGKTGEAPSPQDILAAEQLLRAADSLPATEISARAARLPQPLQDSFFTRRLAALETVENDEAIKQTLKIFRDLHPESLLAKGLEGYYYGIFAQYAGQFDSADVRYTAATRNFEAAQADFFLAKTFNKHAGCRTTQGNTAEAIAMNYRALDILKRLGNKPMQMKVQTNLANTFNLKGDFDQAIALLEEPLAFYKEQKDTIFLAYMLAMKGTAYISKKEYEKALPVHREALAMRQKVKAKSGVAESLFHVGRSLLKLERWQEALDTLRVAETVVRNGSDKQGIAFIEAGIGEALYNLGRFEEAEQYLNKSLELSVKRKQYPPASQAAARLSIMRKKQGRFEDALRYHEQFLTYKDSVFNQEKEKISRELTVKYETHEKELTITALERENRLATQRNRWIGGSLTLLSIIGFYTLRIRSLRKQELLALEKAQSEAKALQLARELEIKNLELAAHATRLIDYTQMLVERNRQLNDLTTQIQSGKTSAPSEDAENLFNLVILTEADWEKFQEYFNRAYPGYINKLRTRYPDLTPAEIRLVLLDKMGLSQKETSAILGIGIDGVKKGRYRLKKKYNLEQDDLAAAMPVD